IGASRLWRALAKIVPPTDLTLVVNTGDDLWIHGLRVCPDLDTTLYALADRHDGERGWGLRDESFRCMDGMRKLGHDVWFNLGDQDLATHLHRTGLLRAGVDLSEVTRRLAAAMGVTVRVLPMTDAEVTTRVTTTDGRRLHYEEFLVREHAVPAVEHVGYDREGGTAEPAPGVLDAILAADLVVLAPSNPLASIGPILDVPGIRDAVAAAPDVVAVAPIVSGVPITDPGERGRATARAALLASIGIPATASGVARLYADLCRRYVLDVADADEADTVTALGLQPVLVPTLVHRGACARGLVEAVLGHSGT
ncbi:MAG TPA: 2-phospho-L-lactate transferase, partial [Nocardioides sp.]|nr:2-phospho-L-lactate transferase [Nocardioides sp.]